ncbi:hypothetical protein ACFV7Q_24975 [Streptomyces sp. NPDC059851]|uniref:hypothetical protein n=1 Tax=Streptomyces sp. NPDC059851 TaxID=3346971 RepID=UPI003649BF2C
MYRLIASTMELHQLYLERLSSVKDEGLVLPAITGVFDTPLLGFQDAVAPVAQLLSGLDRHVERSHEFGKRRADEAACGLSADAIAALYLYTCESAFYREINAVLRSPDRAELVPYLPCPTCACCSRRCRSCPPAPSHCSAGCRWTCAPSTRWAAP